MGKMDGTWLTKIVEDSETFAITLDKKSKRVYWVQDFFAIESSDYDGKNRQLVFSDSVGMSSLAILDDKLYWLWPNYGHVNATLWSCLLKNNTCTKHAAHEDGLFRNAKHMKAILDPNEETKNVSNICSINNGGCQHLCLITGYEDRSCACKLGWQLNPDRRTCRYITDFVLYVIDNYIKGRIIDNAKPAFVDVFWPITYDVITVNIKGMIDFDYDLANDNFYFSDDIQIYRMKLRSPIRGNQTILLPTETSYVIEDLALDWITGNMYYSLRSRTYSKRHYLMMFNVNKGSEYKKVIANYAYDAIFGLQACPYALAIYPSKGYLFFTVGGDTQRSIETMTMNGTHVSQIFQIPFVHEHRLIDIDYEKDKIYWIYNTNENTKIKCADFDGSNEKIIEIDSMRMAKTVSVYHQWIYISNDTGIWRVQKDTGHGLSKILDVSENYQNSKKIIGTRLLSLNKSSENENNPCAMNNGGCERFCFAAPIKTCD